jgi:hypothetical protein
MTGVAIGPCTSRNGRIYTRENLANAVNRMQGRLASGTPISMAASHGDAWDDRSDRVFARLTKVWQNESTGDIEYDAAFAPTQLGQEMRALYKEGFIKSQSIRGEWLGDVRVVQDASGDVLGETADDMDIVGLDATLNPGVVVAGMRTVETASSARGARQFVESAPVQTAAIDEAIAVAWVDEADKKPYGNVTYADPGYQKDGKERYPLDTEKHIRAAWGYINQKDNASLYSAADLAKVRARIKAAMKKIGAEVEAYMVGGPSPAQLLDPDNDGDIDAMRCPSCGVVSPVTDVRLNPDAGKDETRTGLPNDDAMEASQKENVMSETAANGAATPAPSGVTENEPTFHLSPEAFAKSITEANLEGFKAGMAAARGAAAPTNITEAAPAATTTETAPAGGTAEGGNATQNAVGQQSEVELTIVKVLRENGILPDRKGLVENHGEDKPKEGAPKAPMFSQAALKEARSSRAAEINEQYPQGSVSVRRRAIRSGRP